MIDSFMNKKRFQQIRELLLAERQRILEGPLTDIAVLAEKREKLVETLMENGPEISLTDLEVLKRESQHNQRLLQASITGMKEAQMIIAQQRKAQTSMGTYTQEGRRLETPALAETNDRRA
ncbi:MAG: hypothetical protein V3V13_01690 [Paracoccaceae bacterium]